MNMPDLMRNLKAAWVKKMVDLVIKSAGDEIERENLEELVRKRVNFLEYIKSKPKYWEIAMKVAKSARDSGIVFDMQDVKDGTIAGLKMIHREGIDIDDEVIEWFYGNLKELVKELFGLREA